MKTIFLFLALNLALLTVTIGQTPSTSESEVATTPEYKAAKAAEKNRDGATMLSQSKLLVARFPDSALAHRAMADAYYYMSFFDEASASAQKAIEISPKDPIAWRNLGQIRTKQEKHDEAEAAYKSAINAAKTDATPWADIAYFYARRGNASYALQCANYASKLLNSTPFDNHNGETPEEWTWRSVAEAYLTLKRPLDAIPLLKRAIAIQPNDHGMWLELTFAYYEAGDRTNAIAAAEQAVKLAPDSPETKLALQSLTAPPPQAAQPQQPQQTTPEQMQAYIELLKSLQRLTGSGSSDAPFTQSALPRNDRIRMLYVLRDAKIISSIRDGERMNDSQIINLYNQALQQNRLRNIEDELRRLQR